MKTTRKNLLIFFGALAVCAGLYFFVYWPISPLGQQLRNLNLAGEQAKLLHEQFKNDARFQTIKFTRYTGMGGCLEVFGAVQTPDDFFSITNSIEARGCPVGIYYDLMTSNQLARFVWFDREDNPPLFESFTN